MHQIYGKCAANASKLFFLGKEIYYFANEGENHTNNVKQLENMKKAMEDSSNDSMEFVISCASDVF